MAFSVGLVLGLPPGVTFSFEPAKIKADMSELLRDMLDRFYEGQGRDGNVLPSVWRTPTLARRCHIGVQLLVTRRGSWERISY